MRKEISNKQVYGRQINLNYLKILNELMIDYNIFIHILWDSRHLTFQFIYKI
jgi:hypothetical protein